MERYKNETLIKRLERYDQKYYEALTNYNDIGFGYSMRAYSRLKNCNPPHDKIKEKARAVADELISRGVKFNTIHLKIYN